MTDTETHTAQAALADILATHMPDPPHGHDGTRNHQIAAEALTSLGELGYAFVKLPTPLHDDAGTAHVAYSGANTVYYAAAGRVDSDTFQTWKHPDDARDDAAALLAASRAADTMEPTQ